MFQLPGKYCLVYRPGFLESRKITQDVRQVELQTEQLPLQRFGGLWLPILGQHGQPGRLDLFPPPATAVQVLPLPPIPHPPPQYLSPPPHPSQPPPPTPPAYPD